MKTSTRCCGYPINISDTNIIVTCVCGKKYSLVFMEV